MHKRCLSRRGVRRSDGTNCMEVGQEAFASCRRGTFGASIMSELGFVSGKTARGANLASLEWM